MAANLEIFEAQIVLAGEFLPSLYSPEWFGRMGLLGEDDVAAAIGGTEGVGLLVSSQMTIFATNWVHVQVIPNQLTLRSQGAPGPAMHDLAQGLLTSIDSLVVRAVGLNYGAHYRPDTMAELHRIGDAIVPKGMWHEAFPSAEHIGLANLQVIMQPKGDAGIIDMNNDYQRFFVQPSAVVQSGIYLGINNHYRLLADDKSVANGSAAAALIGEKWESSWRMSAEAFDKIIERALKAS